jgi:hypothetical protein
MYEICANIIPNHALHCFTTPGGKNKIIKINGPKNLIKIDLSCVEHTEVCTLKMYLVRLLCNTQVKYISSSLTLKHLVYFYITRFLRAS